MKQILFSFLLILLPMLVSAETVEIDGISYNLVPKAKEAEVVEAYLYPSDNLEIPASVTYNEVEYSVTSIGGSAFLGFTKITSVTIPNTVTSIGKGAFSNCRFLTSVTIPKSVTSIGENAFYFCEHLKAVYITDIESWCNISFSNVYSNPLYYAHQLYLNGDLLTSLVISNNVTSIGKYAFSGCSSLTFMTIPNSVTSIGDYAFKSCNSITSITIPSSVTSIGMSIFSGCSSLTSVTIPNSVKSIGKNTFYDCSSLTSVTIPNSVTSIGESAFYGCRSLTSITIPNSVTSIEGSTFHYCSSLTSVTIPNSVTSIGESAFYYCSGLTSITIPNSVTSIKSSSFRHCRGLTSITIPNSVTSISKIAFADCISLTSVTIGSGVNYIGEQAFANCYGIKDVYCLADKLTSRNRDGESLYTYPDAFEGSYPQYMTLHVPAASIEAYRSTEPWSQFKTIVALKDDDNPEPPEILKCASPEISYADGKLTFTCETEGAECVATITDPDIKTHYGNEITLSQKYTVTVYATKSGYDNSDTVTREIIITGSGKTFVVGDVDGNGKVNVADHVKLSNIIMNK